MCWGGYSVLKMVIINFHKLCVRELILMLLLLLLLMMMMMMMGVTEVLVLVLVKDDDEQNWGTSNTSC